MVLKFTELYFRYTLPRTRDLVSVLPVKNVLATVALEGFVLLKRPVTKTSSHNVMFMGQLSSDI